MISLRLSLCSVASAVLVLSAGFAGSITSASAATLTDLDLGTPYVSVVSSTHQHLTVSIGAELDSTQQNAYLVVTVTKHTGATIKETHGWQMQIPTDDFVDSKGTSNVTLSTYYDAGPLGSVNLRFSTKTMKSAPCATGSELIAHGTLTGSFTWNTGGGAWGKLSTGSGPSFGAATQTVFDYNCKEGGSNTPPNCITGTSWNTMTVHATKASTATFYGSQFSETGTAPENIVAIRSVVLPGFYQAQRTDLYIVPESIHDKSGTVSIAPLGANKLITGAATIKGGTYSASTSGTCRVGAATKTQDDNTTSNAHWSNVPGHTLTVHSAVGPNMTVPNTPGAMVDIQNPS